VVNWVLTRTDKGERGNIYHLTILGLNAMPFIPDREHNGLPLENWMLCREITTVCCQTNKVHIHTYINTHTDTRKNMCIHTHYVYKEAGFRILALMVHKLATSFYGVI
jgi:hypothetical protein